MCEFILLFFLSPVSIAQCNRVCSNVALHRLFGTKPCAPLPRALESDVLHRARDVYKYVLLILCFSGLWEPETAIHSDECCGYRVCSGLHSQVHFVGGDVFVFVFFLGGYKLGYEGPKSGYKGPKSGYK